MRILGTGSALPRTVVTNDMLKQYFDTSDEWIRTRTGIETRRIMTDETLRQLASQAAQRALDSAGMKATDIDFIVCSNVSNNYVYPSLSSQVQGDIGATCPCIDIRNACAGFVYAMDVAQAYLDTGRASRIMVLAAEEPTRFCHWEHRETSVLFGDGAAAAIVKPGGIYMGARLTTISNSDMLYQRRRLESTPFEVEGAYIDHTMVMLGKEVFRMAVSSCSKEILDLLDDKGFQTSDVKYFLLHQANMRIIQGIKERMNGTDEQFPTTIQKYGNTSSASIAILLDELWQQGNIKKGDLIVMSGFGAGFTTGSLLMRC